MCCICMYSKYSGCTAAVAYIQIEAIINVQITSSHIKEAESSIFLNRLFFFFPPHFQLQKAKANETDEADEEPTVVPAVQVFAPKSLVLVSRLDHTEVFKVHCSTLPIINYSSCMIKRISVYI